MPRLSTRIEPRLEFCETPTVVVSWAAAVEDCADPEHPKASAEVPAGTQICSAPSAQYWPWPVSLFDVVAPPYEVIGYAIAPLYPATLPYGLIDVPLP